MKRIHLSVAALLLCSGIVNCAHASDRSDVYARIDKVVFEPNAEAPERVQIWGVFAVRDLYSNSNQNTFQPAKRGYLYFKIGNLPDPRHVPDPKLILTEWNDLKRVAGTGQVISFGLYTEIAPRIRNNGEKPADPQVYYVNAGVVKVASDTSYEPIRSVANFKD